MPEREKFGARMDDQLKIIKERIESTSKSTAESRGSEFFQKQEEELTKAGI